MLRWLCRRWLLRLSYCRRKADNNKGSHCKAESKSSRRSFHAAHMRTGVGAGLTSIYANQINNKLRAIVAAALRTS